MLCSRSCILFALLCAFLLSSSAVATPSPAVATVPPDTDTIKALATDAYVWGLGLETIYRLSKYNTIIGAPYNKLKYGTVPAAWNNEATNGGDASVVYLNAFVNFDDRPELVFTVPPTMPVPPDCHSQPVDNCYTYYVAAYYDAYGNDVASWGTRTTPTARQRSYLLVGPTSQYAHQKTATIDGYTYPVMASDTALNWFLIRVRANTLIDSSDPASVPSIVNLVAHGFYLNTLREFELNHHMPVPPTNNYFYPPPSERQQMRAAPYQNTPPCAVEGGPGCSGNQPGYFNLLGNAVASNPIPTANTGLSGTLVRDLPKYVLAQYGASPSSNYLVPANGQQRKLDSFALIGLTKHGFHVPRNWGQTQLTALQAGFEDGKKILKDFFLLGGPACTNYWGITNDLVGTYPNTEEGYLFRSLSAFAGGVSNYPLDAIYPNMTSFPAPDNTLMPLDGDNTYKVTFTLPGSSPIPGPCTPSSAPWPVSGILPPLFPEPTPATIVDPAGFWSIHVYAQDPSEAAAPFIAQTTLQNLHYSTEYTPVLSVYPAPTNTIKVMNPKWGKIVSSTPIRFGENAADYGLMPNTVYFAVCADPPHPSTCPNADGMTSTFSVSTQWIQDLDTAASPTPVPIQGPGGTPGLMVALPTPIPGAGPLEYAMVKPVTQLGSTQLTAGQLHIDTANNSVTLWFGPGQGPGGHEPPAGAPASNWIPTPNTAYYQTVYPEHYQGDPDKPPISTGCQLMMRMYYPWAAINPPPSGPPPSILPCKECYPQQNESYIPPTVTCVSGPSCRNSMSTLGNISARSFVQTDDNVMISGFMVQGTGLKSVIIRALGPELAQYGIPNALANPTLELYDGSGALIASNNNWTTTIMGGIIHSNQVQEIQASGYAPTDPLESAIIADLPPGNYTAIVRGVNNLTGVALVEMYSLSPEITSILNNISSRGFVQTGDDVMIGGFMVQGSEPQSVIIRALGPELTQYGIPDALANPTLELYDGAGALIASNNNWTTTIMGGIITSNQVHEIQASGYAPTDPLESAIIADLPPDNYTAIVRGVNNLTGVGLVEVYNLH